MRYKNVGAMKRFVRRRENFICEICGKYVVGDGYTNHCPACLYSKHVDVNPGDRAARCGGMMRPINVEVISGKQVIIHRCDMCGIVRKNKVQEQDNFDQIVDVVVKNTSPQGGQ